MGAIKEHYHDQICAGQRKASRNDKPGREIKACKNCGRKNECGESAGPDDYCEYYYLLKSS
jgi:hypothetical protein